MKKICVVSYFLFLISILGLPEDLFSQNIGIGITNPTRAKLELHGAVGATSAIFGGEGSGISLQANWPSIGFNQYYNNGSKYISTGYAAVQYLDPNNGYMALDMFGTGIVNNNVSLVQRAFTIANNGNIGIRTSPANASLYVIKGTNFGGSAVFGGATSYNSHFNYGDDEHTYIRAGKNSSNVYLNDIPGGDVVFGAGNNMVGINSGNPTYTLEIRQVNEKGLLLVDPWSNYNNWEQRVNLYLAPPASDLRLYYNGSAVGGFSSHGGYGGTVSDSRVKTNITILPAVLDKIKQLMPVEYEMKDHNNRHEKTIGFIAQDVKALFPALVTVIQVTVDSTNKIPDLHSLDYTGLSVISIKAIQEQYDQIKSLQKENDRLMKRLGNLEKMIALSL
ncbi:hypothetical protein BH10BAC3_BH10BAC3_23680 [soil metagenome]